MNQTLAERERAAYISGNTELAAVLGQADDVQQNYDLLEQFYELCAEGAGLSPSVTPVNAMLLADAMQDLFRKFEASRHA